MSFLFSGGLFDVIPDSVVHQYKVENFNSTVWEDSVGSADMTVNGLVAGTFSNGEDSVYGDGNTSNAHGLATGPEQLPGLQTEIAIAFTIEYPTPNDLDVLWGASDGNNIFQLSESDANDGSLGEFRLALRDGNSNNMTVETAGTWDDGQVHLVVINKTTNNVNGVNIYVDDMSSSVNINIRNNETFDPNAYSMSGSDMGFYGRCNSGSIENYYEYHSGFFEFNLGTYSQEERENIKTRIPEI